MMRQTLNPVDPARELPVADPFARAVGRRSFLRYTGATAVIGGLLLTGCSDDDDDTVDPNANLTTKLTNNDTGILNYAYALEQLEAAFYTQVVEKGTAALSTSEMDAMKAIRDHEIAHRDFFKSVLGSNRLKDLEVNFDGADLGANRIDFTNKTSILRAALSFEDLGVSAYNGAGRYLTDAVNLTLAGKIVSVEARHAAFIREMIAKNTAASRQDKTGINGIVVPRAVDNQGLDMVRKPSVVLPLAAVYLKTAITSDLP